MSNTQPDQPPFPFDAEDRSAIRWLLSRMCFAQDAERERAIASAIAHANLAKYYEEHGTKMDGEHRARAVESYARTVIDALDNADKATERLATFGRWQRYFAEGAGDDA